MYSLYGTFITTPLTIAMYATMIPWLHATGAALASTLSYLASFVLMCWFYRRVTGSLRCSSRAVPSSMICVRFSGRC